VRIVADPENRRCHLLIPTDKGQDLLASAKEAGRA
jgi:DNA-binding MarR family transcriptional regulator